MGEATRLTQVPAHTLRYWEDVRLLRPTRLSSGHRRYTREDLQLVLKVRDMIQRRKMTVAGAKRELLGRRTRPLPEPVADGGSAAWLKVVREVRQELQALAREIDKG